MKTLPTITALSLIAGLVTAQETQTTASGLKYEVVQQGKEGTEPKPGDTVRVHYTGTFESGDKFDSSRDRGEPIEFMLGVGQVIPGWDEGIALMTVGSRYKLFIPWDLAYGENGRPPRIPAKSNLLFDVELISVEKGDPLPVFRPLDPEKLQTTESGLKYEAVRAGEGDAPGENTTVRLRYALWNESGDLILSTETRQGMRIAGTCSKISLVPTIPMKFLPEAAMLMKQGAVYRFEVPSALCFGSRAVGPKLPADSTTIWELELLEVIVFEKPDPEKLTTTESGLAYEVVRAGEGAKPSATDTVTVHYTGFLENGTMFDSSHNRGQPTSFPLNRVIAGWTEGLQLMPVGGLYRFVIPGNLAYGPRPPPGSGIPPNATLYFDVELIKIGK